MKRIEWIDAPYSVGLDQGVFYPAIGSGIPWDGLVDVSVTPDGGDSENLYIDGKKFLIETTPEHFRFSIRAVTCPDILFENELLQERLRVFGFSYRETTRNGYLIHLVYNAQIVPQSITYQHERIVPFEFKIDAKPILIPGFKPSAHLVVDIGRASIEAVSFFTDILYGTDSTSPRLPLPSEIITLFANNSAFKVVDNGDGTWSATSTNGSIEMFDSTTFQITTDSAVWVDTNSYILYSF